MGVGQKDLDKKLPAWTGHLQKYAGAITAADMSTLWAARNGGNVFDPRPLRGVMATSASGNIVVTLNGDDETDTGTKATIPLTMGVPETRFAIRKIWGAGSGTTATGIVGYF